MRAATLAQPETLNGKVTATAPPPSTGRYPDSDFTAGGSALYGALPSVPVLACSRPLTGESVKMSARVPDTPATGSPAPRASVGL